MIGRLVGPVIVFALVCLGSLVVHFIRSGEMAADRLATSGLQSSKGVVRVGLDGYAGYAPLRAVSFRNRLLESGYRVEYADDAGDYAARVAGLADGKLDLAVFTVDSYVLNGLAADYPGSIIAVLSESVGSDGMVARSELLASIDAIKQGEGMKLAFTPNSPSHHLLKTLAVDFDIPRFLESRGAWSVPVDGSVSALQALESGAADVAILWEPELSKAIRIHGFQPVISTENTDGLIVDVLVASRELLLQRPEVAEVFLATYFYQLNTYRASREQFVQDIAEDAGVQVDVAEQIIDGIQWKNYEDNTIFWLGLNREWVGQQRYKLYTSIDRTVEILMDFGDLKKNPLPDQDPRSLIYENTLSALSNEAFVGGQTTSGAAFDALATDFKPLSLAEWQRLARVGTLKLRPISFRSGQYELTETGVASIEAMVEALRNYPNFRVIVSGHTSLRGDAEANRALSEQRAQSVVDYICQTFGVDADRLLALGRGGDEPTIKRANESYRAYQNRLARVEFTFVRDHL